MTLPLRAGFSTWPGSQAVCISASIRGLRSDNSRSYGRRCRPMPPAARKPCRRRTGRRQPYCCNISGRRRCQSSRNALACRSKAEIKRSYAARRHVTPCPATLRPAPLRYATILFLVRRRTTRFQGEHEYEDHRYAGIVLQREDMKLSGRCHDERFRQAVGAERFEKVSREREEIERMVFGDRRK